MSPHVTVDARSGLAPWRQIHDQLAALVDADELVPGTRLPAIRRLARDLGVAPGTVARAYRELEAGGRVRTARGGGTVTAARTPASSTPDPGPATVARPGRAIARTTAPVTPGSGDDRAGDHRLEVAAHTYLDVALALGADLDAALEAVRAAASTAAPPGSSRFRTVRGP
ncbi:MAG: GntR family transcriptional regulator [Pseudonocardia sp.]|nr:GntR family transcriptional regulator [Pseudonocardia sp.]